MFQRTEIKLLTVIVIGLITVFYLSKAVEDSKPALPMGYIDSDLALRGEKLKGFALGGEGLIADWYWMQSLQYVGQKVLNSDNSKMAIDDMSSLDLKLLYSYLDNATSLDPRFYVPYAYGAVLLPSIDRESAIKLTKKGIENNPDSWRLYQHLGYIYWKIDRYEEAARVYTEGANKVGASPFMKLMAANMESRGGSRSTARMIYKEMAESAADQQTKAVAQTKLDVLAYLDEIEHLQLALDEVKKSSGVCPRKWADVLPFLKEISLPDGLEFHIDNHNNLTDPSGVPYLLDGLDCRVKLDVTKSRIIVIP